MMTTLTTESTIHTNGNGQHEAQPDLSPAVVAGVELPIGLTKSKLQIWLLNNAGDFSHLCDEELEITALEINDATGIAKNWLDDKWTAAVKKARPPEPESEPERENKITWETYRAAVERFGYTIRMNDLDDTVETNGEKFSDGIEAEILMKMHDINLRKADWVRRSIVATAHANRYHPIRDFLSSLVWDGKDWIAEFERYVWDIHPKLIYADGSVMPVFGAWLKRWGIGAVAKIMQRGKLRGQNPMLVLAGPQDVGKSTLARFLNPLGDDFFIESGINPDSKDHDRYLATKFIWEVAELGATTRKADREALKSFLTRQDVTFRTPYAHHPVTKPATANFIGTINPETGFLSDPTGHRRFLPVELTKIDFGYLTKIDCHQLWAQFVALYSAGERASLTPEEKRMADDIRGVHEIEDPYAGFILKYYQVSPEQKDWKETTTDIVDQLLLNGAPGANVTNVGLALKGLGLGSYRATRAKITTWVGIQRNNIGSLVRR